MFLGKCHQVGCTLLGVGIVVIVMACILRSRTLRGCQPLGGFLATMNMAAPLVDSLTPPCKRRGRLLWHNRHTHAHSCNAVTAKWFHYHQLACADVDANTFLIFTDFLVLLSLLLALSLCRHPAALACHQQGSVVMIMLLAYGLAKHTFGPDAGEFKPQRWLAADAPQLAAAANSVGGCAGGSSPGPASSSAGASAADADAESCSTSPSGSGADKHGGDVAADHAAVAPSAPAPAPAGKAAASTPPDPFTFLAGPRDW